MWIALAIIGFLAMLITTILLLPVKVIIKNDENNQLIFRYKYLFKTFGENPDPNDPIVKALKSATGVDRLQKDAVQKNIQNDGLKKTVTESYSMLVDLLKQVVRLLKRCVITRLHIQILCTGDNAAEAAVHYGQCSAATYSLLHLLANFLKIKKRGCKVDIGCDISGAKPVFRYDVMLSIRAGLVLAALWDVAMAETKRMSSRKVQDHWK